MELIPITGHLIETNEPLEISRGSTRSGDPNFDQPATFTIQREMPLLQVFEIRH